MLDEDKEEEAKPVSNYTIMLPNTGPMLTVFSKDLYFLNMAYDTANMSIISFQHGAVLVYKRDVISTGYNSICKLKDTTNDRMASCHAEAMAVINALMKMGNKIHSRNLSLYVTRRTKSGKFGESSPCTHCTEIMQKYKIGTLVYTTYTGDVIKKKLKDYVPRKGARVTVRNRYTWNSNK